MLLFVGDCVKLMERSQRVFHGSCEIPVISGPRVVGSLTAIIMFSQERLSLHELSPLTNARTLEGTWLVGFK